MLIFSPHPDDDVISMGGTLIRLVEQGHDVQVAYMTSGNIAVFDHDADRFVDFVAAFNRLFGIDEAKTAVVKEGVQEFLKTKTVWQPDTDVLLKVKGLIRETEARAAALGVRRARRSVDVHGPEILPDRNHRQSADSPAGHRRHCRVAPAAPAGSNIRRG